MLEPLSPELTKLLLDNGLCRPGDLRRCRSIVRRLTSDLPVFDSVWIDALVQRNALTPFQASLLQSDHPEQLSANSYLLVDRLGGSRRSETFLAKKRGGSRRFALKSLSLREEEQFDAVSRLEAVIATLSQLSHPHIAAPRELFAESSRTVVVSEYVPGFNLRELLIRRGRFPVPVVRALARQMLSALQRLDQAGHVHGDLRLENIKLSPQGRGVLVETGIRAALSPKLSFVTELTCEHCETIAPELVASGRQSDQQSDFYSLGCVLWNLLTGRSPIQDADPLAKLAAHQQRSIRDVRDWSPDVPADLAEAVARLVSRDRTARPGSISEAVKLLGRPRWGDRRILKEFQAFFLSQAPAWTLKDQTRTGPRWGMLASAVVVATAISIGLLDETSRTNLLALANRVTVEAEAFFAEPTETVEQAENPEQIFPELPAPDAAGVITLTGSGPFRAGKISVVGPLVIKSNSETYATVICEQPLDITCESLQLEGITFRPVESFGSGALLRVRSLDLAIRDCQFLISELTSSATSEMMGVAWKTIDADDRSGGRVMIERTQFIGGSSQIYFATSPAAWKINQTLSLGGEAFARFRTWPTPERSLSVDLSRVCLRNTKSLLQFDPPGDPDTTLGEIFLSTNGCVFELSKSQSALFLFTQESVPPALLTHLSLTGEESFASETLVVAGRKSANEVIPLPTESLAIEGLVTAPVTFAGPLSKNVSDSQVTEVSGPRLSPEMPGIDAIQLSPREQK